MDSIFKYNHPFVCVDAVIFSIHTYDEDNYRKLPIPKLCVALYKRKEVPFKDLWCLPGGFINIDETPEESIKRNVLKKIHILDCHLEQLYTFSRVNRDPRARVISISYLGLISEIQSQELDCKWFDIIFEDDNIKLICDSVTLFQQDLGFDHIDIIKYAITRLRAKVTYSDVIFDLLPEKFTLTQYQNAYEAITGELQQVANFRRKIIENVIETNEMTTKLGHRPARLFERKTVK